MINQSIKLKILILPASLALVVVAIVFFIKPSFFDMNEKKKILSEKQSQLDSLNGQGQKIKELKLDWESLGDEKTLVQMALPESENMDTYISELTSKASRSGILLSDVQKEAVLAGSENAENLPYICSVSSEAFPGSTQSSIPAETAAGTSAPNDLSNSTSPSNNCLKMVKISITAKGIWEQFLDFFKYLEDMNRISNIDKVVVAVEDQSQEQASSNLLSINISMNAFFKKGRQAGDIMFAAGPATPVELNQKAIEKLKEAIYAPYAAPLVSPNAERNIFK
jgi:Tfp pilus assembly protein PilO